MDHIENAIFEQRRYAPVRMPLLHKCMGWVLRDDYVFIYGCNGICSAYGITNHTQAVEFLASDFQLFERQAI